MALPGLEELEAKVRAATEALDPTAVLLADHEWLRALLDEYHSNAGNGEDLERLQLAIRELKPKLDLHIKREEEAYFPAVEAFVQALGRGSTVDMYGEHDAIHIRLDQLLTADRVGRASECSRYIRGLLPLGAHPL
jgi:hypothetical protein